MRKYIVVKEVIVRRSSERAIQTWTQSNLIRHLKPCQRGVGISEVVSIEQRLKAFEFARELRHGAAADNCLRVAEERRQLLQRCCCAEHPLLSGGAQRNHQRRCTRLHHPSFRLPPSLAPHWALRSIFDRSRLLLSQQHLCRQRNSQRSAHHLLYIWRDGLRPLRWRSVLCRRRSVRSEGTASAGPPRCPTPSLTSAVVVLAASLSSGMWSVEPAAAWR